jgi:hypothetical protein
MSAAVSILYWETKHFSSRISINNPDKVSVIYGENPVLRSSFSTAQPLDHLDLLAKAGVTLLHVCGSDDPGLNDNTRVAEKKYKELGGSIRVIIKEGEGHYPLAPKDPAVIADLIVKSAVITPVPPGK